MKSLRSIKTYIGILNTKLTFLTASFLFPGFCAYSQNVSASIDRNKILIGEQVTLQIKVENFNARTTFLQNWFYPPDTATHLQVVNREPVDTIDVGGLITYMQKLTLTSFDSGKWKLDPMQVIMQERSTGKKTILQTDSLFLEVLPVDVSNMQNYHDIKDILAVETRPDYTLYIAIAVSCIILAILIYLLVKRKRVKKEEPPQPVYKGTPLEYALQKIKELEQESLPAKGQVKLFYTKLSDICRNYFSDQLHVRSTQSTSDELMVLLGVYLQNEKYRTHFYQLLRLADAVKFAKYIPVTEQDTESVKTAVASLQHIDELIKSATSHA
ncbi:MAG TPA: hypothetical protein VH396_11915 [Chitinophagaceae bacterium]